MSEAQDRYVDVLLDRIEADEYPSVELMDRVEQSLRSQEELDDYVDMLLSKVESTRYPSKQLLDRIQRLSSYAG